MGNLTLPEWRLFLLSECITVYGDVYEHTALLRHSGKDAVLSIEDKDRVYLNNFISEADSESIREHLRKEWKFSGKVTDNGAGNYTMCEYCQKQEIRYQYLCVNVLNHVWLSLGSVCVGRIIHGERKMQDKEFSKKFISGLEALRVKQGKEASNPEPPKDNIGAATKTLHELRLGQHHRIKHATSYLRQNGYSQDRFFTSLEGQWKEGKLLTEKQETELLKFYNRVKGDSK